MEHLLYPCDLLHILLQILLRSTNIEHCGIKRVMSHDLGESMQGNRPCIR